MVGRGAKMGVRLLAATAVALSFGSAVSSPVRADIGSDHPAAILVFPKILVDTATGLDTLIRMSNVSDTPINVYCFYVNATPICSIPGGSCFPNQLSCQATIGGQVFIGSCLDNWQPNDFTFRLTREQPTGWTVSKGQSTNCPFLDGVCSNDQTKSCQRDTQCGAGNRCVVPPCLPLDGSPMGRVGPGGQTNEGAIPLSPDDPFIGELKCIAVDENGDPVTLSDLRGTPVVVYFYPKASTPGCTTQACGVRDHEAEYARVGARVLGVSPDPVRAIKKFHDKKALNFTLLADEDHAVCERYGVWGERSLAGVKYLGASRSTFIVDADGRIAHVIEKASPKTHDDEVLAALA